MQLSEIYNATQILSALPSCAEAICIKETESTNNIAKELALQGASHCTAILADRQSAGRGRRGKSFFSPDGGIYLSLILRERENVPYTVCAASAVCRAIRSFDVDAKIKWVNDVYIEGKKVCGILCERVCDTQHGNAIIVGIGINHSVAEFPEDIKEIATSLPAHVPSREIVAITVIEALLSELEDVRASKAYYAENMMLYGKAVSYRLNGEEHIGTVVGLGENEELLIKTSTGTVALSSGIVTAI